LPKEDSQAKSVTNYHTTPGTSTAAGMTDVLSCRIDSGSKGNAIGWQFQVIYLKYPDSANILKA